MIAGPSGIRVLILMRLPWVNKTYYYYYHFYYKKSYRNVIQRYRCIQTGSPKVPFENRFPS